MTKRRALRSVLALAAMCVAATGCASDGLFLGGSPIVSVDGFANGGGDMKRHPPAATLQFERGATYQLGCGQFGFRVIDINQDKTLDLLCRQTDRALLDMSFNAAPGISLGQAVEAIHRAEREIGIPAAIRAEFSGNAQAFKDSLSSQPMLILAALLAVYIVLGMLYESFIHPITILSTLPSAGLVALLACRSSTSS